MGTTTVGEVRNVVSQPGCPGSLVHSLPEIRPVAANEKNECYVSIGLNRDVPLTPYFHLTDGNLTKDTYNVLRRL